MSDAPSTPKPTAVPPAPASTLGAVAARLRARVAGEVRFDDRARALYATDASPYEIEPYGVVLPKGVDDVRGVMEVAREYGLPVLPRGGGTSLAGQTVGEAIVLDFSKYMTRILELDVEGRRVRVEPGVIRDDLNAVLAEHELQFTPDVSTTNRAAVGGMVANNSAGTRSIKYGKSVDQVVAMTVMLADGSVVELGEVDERELDAKKAQDDLEGEIYRTVHGIVTEHEDEIVARFPKVMRRVGGYNLDEFTEGRPFNLAKLVSGSEGTLALILDVTLKLFPVPRHRMLAMVHFATMHAALSAVKFINEHDPSAVEILDDRLFELGRENPSLTPLIDWVEGRPEAVLLVEFDGQDDDEMRANLASMERDGRVAELSYHTYRAFDTEAQKRILEFRRAGLGIYATIRGRNKSTPFIEDPAIPPEHLPDYVPEVLAVCRRHGVDAVVYGHASVGVLHIRPLLDLKSEDGVAAFEGISRDVFDLVVKYGGSWSGEHGDGLIRSYQNRNLFGEVIYQDFRALKRAFDPQNLLNPGKIIEAQGIAENLRFGTDYPRVELPTYFDFGEDGYLGAIEMCTGVGACRKTATGTMCPSFMATRDEDHSTRGRANILREALTGKMPGGMTSQEVYDVLDLCLECKACKAECPSQVDMAKIKYEFLQHYWDDHGVPLSVRAIGNVARVAPLAQGLAPIANALLPLPPVRWLIEKTVGVDRRRVLPEYAAENFGRWFRRTRPEARGAADDEAGTVGTVALFADTWTMYNETGPGVAAVRVLEALGYRVELVPYGCCGRPQISKGLLKDAKKLAERNVARLQSYVDRGVPVVGLEPSCVTAFQDDYRDLVPGETTDRVAGQVKMIDQFLARAWSSGEIDPGAAFAKRDLPIMLHGHCQQKAVIGTAPTRAVLEWVSDEVREVDSGCCGMAGSFGYGHYDLSMQVGEQRLLPAARRQRAAGGETVACGFSCRHQIRDGDAGHAKHLTEVMADAIATPPRRAEGGD